MLDEPRCRRTLVAVALTSTLLAVAACGSNSGSDAATPKTGATTPAAASAPPTTAEEGSEPLLVQTKMDGFDGTVLPAAALGESPFCPGGRVHHAQGSPQIGFPAINEFRCDDGALRIGFGPGPAQMDNLMQTSAWRVLDGTGRYAGATGDGRMVVQFEKGDPPRGVETFLGLIVLSATDAP